MTKRFQGKKSGFSLVEVCLAVLVVGLGLLSVFSLFPSGLAAGDAATGDTEMGLFAQEALYGLQARATEVTWAEWKGNTFTVPGIVINTIAKNDKNNLAYRLSISPNAAPQTSERLRRVILTAMPWKGSSIPSQALLDSKGTQYYTELYYMELP